MNTDNKIDEFNKIFLGIWTDALKLKYRKLCGEIIEKQLKDGRYEGTKLQEVYDQVTSLRKQEAENKYYFITICPYDDIELSKLVKVMDKMVKKRWFTSYVYVYEQRQSEEGKPYHGIHTHIIVDKGTVKKAEVIREVYNTCKDIVGSKQSVDVKILETEYDLSTRLNYILGSKADVEKQQKQVIDKIFREENNLQSFYEKNFLHIIQNKFKNAPKDFQEVSL